MLLMEPTGSIGRYTDIYLYIVYHISKMSQNLMINFSPTTFQPHALEDVRIVFPGRPFSYTITLRNFSSQPLDPSVVTDLIPSSVEIRTVSSSTGIITRDGNLINWTVLTLPPFGTATLNIGVELLSSQSGPTIINTANLIEYDGADVSSDNITASVILRVGAFALSQRTVLEDLTSNLTPRIIPPSRKNKASGHHSGSKC